jgi:hypothetical protein
VILTRTLKWTTLRTASEDVKGIRKTTFNAANKGKRQLGCYILCQSVLLA